MKDWRIGCFHGDLSYFWSWLVLVSNLIFVIVCFLSMHQVPHDLVSTSWMSPRFLRLLLQSLLALVLLMNNICILCAIAIANCLLVVTSSCYMFYHRKDRRRRVNLIKSTFSETNKISSSLQWQLWRFTETTEKY